ncbi:MAG: tRNA (N(6)-L-threonylcarbamoyladenosine(37)-C(2))-methylthiotransferase MtaB [Planctomycetota bacterium]|nr:tRNA (N(6)-L-threonylcarbamoyladenosine(37)-C(2))-methylthiotransferase MtaB [Planctomycetota bacterium]
MRRPTPWITSSTRQPRDWPMTRKTAAFITLGCKINQYETEAIREEVLGLGYEEVPPEKPADVYVVNTCAVTATAGVKSRKAMLRAARTNPETRIIVVGCSTAAEKETFARIPQVVFLAGNEEKAQVASFLEGSWKPGEPFPDRDRDILSLRISRYRDRTRATIKVQDGCNNFCSFCIIPHLRGISRSRHPDAVVEEVRRLADAGYLEVVISGIHLQDYGLDLEPRTTLVELLGRIGEVDGLERIRLSSLGPRAFRPELIDVLDSPRFCRHWHIPIQSGSDPVLAVMRRGYTLEEYRQAVARLRERFRDPAITTDVIVGHPGETRERFEESVEVYRELEFPKIHVFPFSAREGTLATKILDERVEPPEIRRRAAVLGELEKKMGLEFRRRSVGDVLEVLVEGEARGDPSSLEGLTGRYQRVRFPAPSSFSRQRFPGTLQQVRALEVTADGLAGEWAERPVEGPEEATA